MKQSFIFKKKVLFTVIVLYPGSKKQFAYLSDLFTRS